MGSINDRFREEASRHIDALEKMIVSMNHLATDAYLAKDEVLRQEIEALETKKAEISPSQWRRDLSNEEKQRINLEILGLLERVESLRREALSRFDADPEFAEYARTRREAADALVGLLRFYSGLLKIS